MRPYLPNAYLRDMPELVSLKGRPAAGQSERCQGMMVPSRAARRAFFVHDPQTPARGRPSH